MEEGKKFRIWLFSKLLDWLFSHVYLHLEMPRHVFCWRYQKLGERRLLCAQTSALLARDLDLCHLNVRRRRGWSNFSGSWHFLSYLRRSSASPSCWADESTGASSNCFSTAAFSEILKGHQLPSQMFIVEVGTYHQAWTFHFTHKRQLCTELQRSSQAIVFSNRIQKEWQIKERRRNLIIAHCGKIPFFVTKLQLLKCIKPSLDTWKTNWNIFD